MAFYGRIIVLLLLATLSRSLAAGELRFRIDVLQPLPGALGSVPTAINDLGQIVGYADVHPRNGNIANQRPIIWDTPQSTPRLLWDDGFFPGFHGGRPRAINNHGVVVGQAQIGFYDGTPLPTPGIEEAVAFVWDEVNGLQSLVMPGDFGPVSEALDINDAGYVVGNVGGIENEQHGVVWHPEGGLTLLPPERQEYFCNARAINDAGQVAGWYGTESGWDQAFFWDANEGLTTIASAGSLGGRAYDLNNLGHVFGEDYGTRQSPGGPSVWSSNEGLRYLSEPDGAQLRWLVLSANDNDLVLGIAQTHSLLWDPILGSRPLLEIVDGSDAWTNLSGRAINNQDQIVGIGIRDERLLSFVLTPVPEPSAIALFFGFILSLVFLQILRMALIRPQKLDFSRRLRQTARYSSIAKRNSLMALRSRIIAFAVFAVFARPLYGGELRFRIDVLEPLPGAGSSVPTAINDLGQIVGYATVGTPNGNLANERPIIWDSPDATPRILWDEGFFPGFKGGRPRAINNHGVVVGQAQASSYDGQPLPTTGIEAGVGFAWDEVRGLQWLVTPAGYGPLSEALDINDSGYIVGNVGGDEDEQHGVVWSPEGRVDLIPDCQEFICNARTINEAGRVAGWYLTDSNFERAFSWDFHSTMETLFGATGGESRAYDVNDDGTVFGHDFGTLDSRGGPSMWNSESGFQYLIEPDGERLRWVVIAGNNHDVVIGSASGYSLVWDPTHGSQPLLDAVVSVDGWTNLGGSAVNDRNQIVGLGIRGDRVFPILFTPVPEPNALILTASFAAISIVACRVRRHVRRQAAHCELSWSCLPALSFRGTEVMLKLFRHRSPLASAHVTCRRGIVSHYSLERLEERTLLNGGSITRTDAFGLASPAIVSRNHEQSDYYIADGVPIPLARRTTEFVVRLKSDQLGASHAELNWPGYAVTRTLDATSFVVSAIPTVLPRGASNFRSDEHVAWWQPMFVNTAGNSRLAIMDEVIVCIQPGYSAEEVLAERGFTFRPLRGSADQFVVSLADGGVFALETAHSFESDPRVAWATPNFYGDFKVTTNDPLYGNQSNLHNNGLAPFFAKSGADAHLPEAWAAGYTGNNEIVVAVIDNGVQLDHPDLNIFTNPLEIPANGIDDDRNGYIDDLHGWDFVLDDAGADPGDNPNPSFNTHGTNVAGIVGAIANNSIGVTGAAQRVSILPVKITNDEGGFGTVLQIAEAVRYAAGAVRDLANNEEVAQWRGADVLNCSWQAGENSAITSAFSYANLSSRGGKGAAALATAGNDADGVFFSRPG